MVTAPTPTKAADEPLPKARFYLISDQRDAECDEQRDLDIVFYTHSKESCYVWYRLAHRIRGLRGKGRRFSEETLQAQISYNELGKLYSKLESAGIDSLPEDEKPKRGGLSATGWLEWNGHEKHFSNASPSETRAKVEAILVGFIKDLSRSPKNKFVKTDRFIQGDDQRVHQLSLKDLVRSPEKHDGKRIRVKGFLHRAFEDSALYQDKKQQQSGEDYTESIWIAGWSSLIGGKEAVELNDEHVVIEGTFDAQDGGHMGLWPGAIVRRTKTEIEK